VRHLDEEIIEQYALNADALRGVEQSAVQSHLDTCEICRELYRYFADFYREVNQNLKTTAPAVDEFHAGLYPVIPLQPYSIREQGEKKRYMTVLAAMSETQTNERFASIATLASEEQHAVVRILQDNSTNRWKIYVIIDDPAKRAHAMVSFPDVSMDFVTDSRGQLEVEHPLADLQSLRGVLRLAVAEHTVRTTALQSEDTQLTLRGGLHSVSVAYVEKNLQIVVSKKKNYAPELQIAVITTAAGESYYVPLENGKGKCAFPALPDSLTLRLYC